MYQMGSLNHITLSNSISYNTGKPGRQERNSEGDYESVTPGTGNREQGISTITSYPYNSTQASHRANTGRTGSVGMKNTTKATYICICITIMLALQIWNVIMIKYIEGRISRLVIKSDNLPIQKQYNIPGSLSLISSKLDSIARDTNYNLPYLIINKRLPKDRTSAMPSGVFLPYGTRMIIYIDDPEQWCMSGKPRRGKVKSKNKSHKMELAFNHDPISNGEKCSNYTTD